MVYIIRTEQALKQFVKKTGFHIADMDHQELKDVFFLPTAFRLREEKSYSVPWINEPMITFNYFPADRSSKSWLVYSIKEPTVSLTSEEELREYYSEKYPGITIKVYDAGILELE